MYRQGLILAGLVGGMVMFGGSALAAMPSAPVFHPDPDNRVIICGDENVFTQGEVDQSTRGVLVLQTGDILSQILGIKSKDSKCVIS